VCVWERECVCVCLCVCACTGAWARVSAVDANGDTGVCV